MTGHNLGSEAATGAVVAPPVALLADSLAPIAASNEARLLVLILVSALAGSAGAVIKELGALFVAWLRSRRFAFERIHGLPDSSEPAPKAYRPDGPDSPEPGERK